MVQYVGSDLVNSTKWEPLDDDQYKNMFGYDIDKQRITWSYMKVEGVPFSDHSYT